jgi:pimeloyl-ACP methyl ester carboxylesterase
MNAARTETLKVPGATLHYEVMGRGPVLLMITGAIMDSSAYAPLAEPLADHYTVVTYDQRGNSRSPLDGPAEDQPIELRADDAHRILEAVTSEPAYVLGCSSGAVIGIDLALRHPDQVRGLLAYEPPIPTVLPDRVEWAALYDRVIDTLERDGVGPAMQTWIAGVGMENADTPEPPAEPSPEMLEAMGRMSANIGFFLGYELRPFSRYEVDLAALRSASGKLAIGVGDASTPAQLPYLSSYALAEKLGVEVVKFRGDHGAPTTHPGEFQARLDECFHDLG